MTIVELDKVTLIGHAGDKERVLDELQELGFVHVVPLQQRQDGAPALSPGAEARDALQFLLTCSQRRRQMSDDTDFDPIDIGHTALDLQRRLRDLRDERDFLQQRIANLGPWGDFDFAKVEHMAHQRMWFYIVPARDMKHVENSGLIWQEVFADSRLHYVVVLSENEPEGMPVPRVRTGAVPRRQLEKRLDEVEFGIEDLEAERASLSRWAQLLARDLDRLEDWEARAQVATQTADVEPVFALGGWAPRERIDELRAFAAARTLALEVVPPAADDDPPTLFENPPVASAGEQLVTFYMTPSYWTWDPSALVFVSFSLFYAMILSDAGYGLVMAAVVLWFWGTMGVSEGGRRFRILLCSLTGTTIVYGVLAGSYFGVSPSPDSLLGHLRVLDVTDAQAMMSISVVIGVAHIAIANLMEARRHGWRARSLPPLGWAAMIVGGFVVAVGSGLHNEATQYLGLAMIVPGAILVFLFSGVGHRPLVRFGKGVVAFTQITKAFGDVLSYLRLFALGMATASLAAAFNDMADGIRDTVPGVGLLLALVVLIIGHGLNFVLGIASGVVHGLRLNVIEFFNWGVQEEGRAYRPFRRKETASWNR